MNSELLSEVIDCLGKGRTHYRYFKGAYAPKLLSMLIAEQASLRALKSSRIKALVEHPLIKAIASQSGNGKINRHELDYIWREPSQPFLLTVSRWGGRSARSWYQTSRFGENLVLQLNLPVEHQRQYNKYINSTGNDILNGNYSCHPVQSLKNNPQFRETLAWSRIDFDFETDEALIEEIQSDAVRYVKSWERRFSRCHCERCKTRLRYVRWMKSYSEVWAEAMLMTTVEFIKNELGVSRIYYHTDRSGWQLKNMNKHWRAPKSLYRDLPKKFAFEQTWAAPQFLSKTRCYKQLVRKQPDIDFYSLDLSQRFH